MIVVLLGWHVCSPVGMRATMYFPTTPWTRLSVSAVLIQAVATLALEAEGLLKVSRALSRMPLFEPVLALTRDRYVFAQFERGVEPTIRQVADGHSMPMYISLFLFGLAYQLVLVFSALSSNSMI